MNIHDDYEILYHSCCLRIRRIVDHCHVPPESLLVTLSSCWNISLLALAKQVIYKASRFGANTDFGVAHYAGEVVYSVDTFLMKNTDKLSKDGSGIGFEESLNPSRVLLGTCAISLTFIHLCRYRYMYIFSNIVYTCMNMSVM